MWNALFVLLKMTKLHSAISQVISTRHGLRSIMQPATPVVGTGKLSAAKASELRQVGLIMKPTRNRQSKDRLSQPVFLKLNLRKSIRIVFSHYYHQIDIPQVNTAYGSACSHIKIEFVCASYHFDSCHLALHQN